MPARGAMNEEDFAREVAAAAREIAACTTVDELRVVWKARFGRIGHKPMARLLIGMPLEAVVAKRTKSMLGR